MVAETLDIGLVERGEGVHVGEEAQRLCDIAQLGANALKLRAQVDDGLRSLTLYSSGNETAVTQTKLTRNDDPVAGTHHGRVRTNRCSHGVKVRRSTTRYPYRVHSQTRREFLGNTARLLGGGVGVLAAGAATLGATSLLAGCGSSAGDGSLPNDVQIVQRFPQNLVVGALRLPLSLASAGGLIGTSGDTSTPETLTARILRIDGGRNDVIAPDLVAPRHAANLAVPYWPFRVDINEPGFYRIVLEGGPSDGAAFQVFARGEVAVPGVGDALRPFETPTFDDARGVDPICTRTPEPCPLHEVTLTEALLRGKPVVLLVGTPAHCSTGTCSPALEALISVAQRAADSHTFIHAEVYADRDATQVAPVVTALSMTYEPALFVTDAQGIVTARLDAVFDEVELASAIS